MLTADHVIGDIEIFRETLREACSVALSDNVLITIGIPPAEPSTGFGYIDVGDELETRGEVSFFKANRFVEKPDRATAEEYFRAGNFYWNSGMFVWSVSSFEDALRRHQPPLARMLDRLLPSVGTEGFDSAVATEYGKLEKISVDYAVMERADNILVTRGNFRWDDVGSWPALDKHLQHDDSGNAVEGICETIDSTGNVVVSGERLSALVGVEGLVVVQAKNATLVCSKERAQDVKKLVKLLEELGEYGDVL
jgi:mannose-1-phosphate guanylyltransferase